MLSLLSEVNSAVWEHSRVRQLYRNTLMTDFAQAFQNDHNNISDAVERDPLLVKLSHLVSQSHITFLMRLGEFIRKMHFHLPLFALILFRTSQKLPQASVKRFLRIKGFLFEIWRFYHSFLMQHFKMHIKTG